MILLNGNCLDELKKLENNSVDSIVTDPPYGLSFMGKKWDYDVPSTEIWTECFRVLKPGGHLLAFFGTRTYHRGVVRIEDAGFEIRDQIQWIYGSGFPKSTNVALRIDKEKGGVKNRGKALNVSGAGDRKDIETYNPEKGMQSAPAYAPSTNAAKQWQGWGTALKPANEPIVVARKPLEKGLTVAENVLKWGCGAINIDASRIEAADQAVLDAAVKRMTGNITQTPEDRQFLAGTKEIKPNSAQGRWPANIILDEEAAQMLDEQSGVLKQGGFQKGSIKHSNSDKVATHSHMGTILKKEGVVPTRIETDTYGASRFFYVAKASKSERNKGLEGMPKVTARSGMGGKMPIDDDGNTRDRFSVTQQNFHPTVKPIKLMEYLTKLVTPPNGTVLDPFMGSGSTGIAAKKLGFNFIGCELSEEYFEIAKKRIDAAE